MMKQHRWNRPLCAQSPASDRTHFSKSITQLASTAGLIALLLPTAHAQGITVRVNGTPVQFQNTEPQQINGRVLVPVRGVLERLGANVAWVPQTRTVVASNANVDIELKIGNQHATVNGKDVFLDVPAQIIAGSTFVPLRFLGEALGAKVGWDGANQTVLIDTGDRPSERPRQPEPVSAAPTINQLSADANGWLRGGQDVHFHMDGTPGAEAAVRIPGLAENIPLMEMSPGRYVGEWRVPTDRPMQITNAAVIGSLRIQNRASALLQAAQLISIDSKPPRIRDVAPDDDTHVNSPRPTIYAVFEDEGSGVDSQRVRLMLNGRDVTSRATLTRDFVSYTPDAPLPAGPQTAELIATDRAGNQTDARWRFIEDVNGANIIRTITTTADHPLGPNDVLSVEVVGAPGAKAAFSIGSINNVVMNEYAPGHYRGTYHVHPGDSVPGRPISVRVTTPDGAHYVQQSTRAVTIAAGRPTPPVIVFPGPTDAPTSPLVIRGQATPNTRVHIKVDYRGKALGLLAVRGTAADMVVDADRTGLWRSTPIDLSSLFGSRDVDYTIQATSIGAGNQTSDPVQMRFRRH